MKVGTGRTPVIKEAKVAETFGSLVDKITVANLKLWHLEEIAHMMTATDKAIAEAKRKINVMNDQRNALIQELDELIIKFFKGETEVKVFQQMKDYRSGDDRKWG